MVGLVRNLRSADVREEPRPAAYVPFPYRSGPSLTLLVRTPLDPAQVVAALRREVRASDPLEALRSE